MHRAGEEPFGVVATEQDGGLVEHEPVDESGTMEITDDLRSTLDHQLHDAVVAQMFEQAIDRPVPGQTGWTRALATAVPSTTRSGSCAGGVPSGACNRGP